MIHHTTSIHNVSSLHQYTTSKWYIDIINTSTDFHDLIYYNKLHTYHKNVDTLQRYYSSVWYHQYFDTMHTYINTLHRSHYTKRLEVLRWRNLKVLWNANVALDKSSEGCWSGPPVVGRHWSCWTEVSPQLHRNSLSDKYWDSVPKDDHLKPVPVSHICRNTSCTLWDITLSSSGITPENKSALSEVMRRCGYRWKKTR